ncbi:hypothetical protein O181_118197 [Austropuccinia psidii MF-1]|uniref:Uncharacterized protein n=1 Tax=Austropuccinia psidii MF-1 TaxID=1389203 RepID=A0A9Q3Q057_9BASI|nr:hypothetical protein [Austropuccinia psidii MF-1]
MVPLGPQQNWAQGASNSPTDRGVQTVAYGPRTAGLQKTEMAKNGHTSSNHQKSPRTPKRPKRPWNQILSRFIIEEATAQDHHRGLFEAISKDNGEKTP